MARITAEILMDFAEFLIQPNIYSINKFTQEGVFPDVFKKSAINLLVLSRNETKAENSQSE